MLLSTLKETHLQLPGTSTGPEAEIHPFDVLNSVYQLLDFTDTGTFSSVAECNNTETKESVAIKIFKKGSQKHKTELAMLKMIRGLNQNNLVRFVENFDHKGYSCLAFERLDVNLHELLNNRPGHPLSLEEIRPITQQLLSALKSLKTVGVIHADIKPQNIMLLMENDQVRVKVIDFGSAVVSAEVKRGVIMQPAAYRSPEVILGLPITEAVDMWSLGGVLATMYLGSPLFPQRCLYYQMKTIVKMLGKPDDNVLRDGTHTLLYFSPKQNSAKSAWRLKTAYEFKAATGFPPQKHRGSSTSVRHLDNLLKLNPEENSDHKQRFVSLLRKMLHLNPRKRITPSDALLHPFITGLDADDSLVEESSEEDSGCAGDSDSLHTSEGASSDMSQTDVACAAAESVDSLVGVEIVAVVFSIDEVSDGAADTMTVDAVPEDEVSALSFFTFEGLLGGGDSNRATTDLYDAVSADKGTADNSAPAMTKAALKSPSTGEGPPPMTVDSTDAHISSEGVVARNSQGKRIRKFFGRIFRALSCCCSANVEQ